MPNNGKTSSHSTAKQITQYVWRKEHVQIIQKQDWVASETAIAIMYNCISYAVMMATPADLEDFALGFSLSEGIIDHPTQILDLEIVEQDDGIVLGMIISEDAFEKLKNKRRNLTGRTGCGLCGAESLEQAITPVKPVTSNFNISHQMINHALSQFSELQALKNVTGAVHGAVAFDHNGKMSLLREDVGRHNALDKLLGAWHKQGINEGGFVVVTSRASYEMVSKVASANIALLVAVSAPTSLAIEIADKSNITLVAFSKPGQHAVYTHADRLN